LYYNSKHNTIISIVIIVYSSSPMLH